MCLNKKCENYKGWQGFLKESKSYMGYGKTISKINFWIRFPRALIRYLYYTYINKGAK